MPRPTTRPHVPRLHDAPTFVNCDPAVQQLIVMYLDRLNLPADRLIVTSDRAEYGRWLGRRVPSAYGGAYCYMAHHDIHAVLINTARIDHRQPRALEVVVAEELVHMRDQLDGDTRRHAHHGHDRIAFRVADLTGATLEEIRSALRPVRPQPARWLYECPNCHRRIARKRRGTWSCGVCSPVYDSRFELQLVGELDPETGEVRGVQ